MSKTLSKRIALLCQKFKQDIINLSTFHSETFKELKLFRDSSISEDCPDVVRQLMSDYEMPLISHIVVQLMLWLAPWATKYPNIMFHVVSLTMKPRDRDAWMSDVETAAEGDRLEYMRMVFEPIGLVCWKVWAVVSFVKKLFIVDK